MSTATLSAPAARRQGYTAIALMAALFAVAPWVGFYPVYLMKCLCFALFACAFNLLIGFGGLLSFGHAMFFGMGSYLGAHAAKVWGLPVELAILTGFALGLVEGLTKVFYPEASNTVIFVIMAIVLLVKPAGLFGRAQ